MDRKHIDDISKLSVWEEKVCMDGFCEERAHYKVSYTDSSYSYLCKKHLDELLTPKEV